jgi:hypothetical protein
MMDPNTLPFTLDTVRHFDTKEGLMTAVLVVNTGGGSQQDPEFLQYNLFAIVKSMRLQLPLQSDKYATIFVPYINWEKFVYQIETYAGHSPELHQTVVKSLGILAPSGRNTKMYGSRMYAKMHQWRSTYSLPELEEYFTAYFANPMLNN